MTLLLFLLVPHGHDTAFALACIAGTSANDAALHAAQALGIGVIVITPTGAVSGLFHLALLHKVSD